MVETNKTLNSTTQYTTEGDNMLFGVQILGLLFGLIMMYLTFLYYKRANYDKTGLIFWFMVWIGFIVLAIFPKTVYGVMEILEIKRTADFFYVAGFLVFSVLLFYSYNLTKKCQKQTELLVRQIALRSVSENKPPVKKFTVKKKKRKHKKI